MKPEDVLKSFRDKFGKDLSDSRIETKKTGSGKNEFTVIWLTLDRKAFRRGVNHIASLQEFPHLAVISGDDINNEIILNYHFSIDYGKRLEELSINLSVKLDKNNLEIETITDIIPGAIITEREIQEMFGVKVKGIPDPRRMFLSKEFPEGVYPWRKDDKGATDKEVRTLNDKK